MAPIIEPIGNPVMLGEGPFWDEEKQILYFVDILEHTLHSYNPKTSVHNTVVVETGGKPVSLIVKIKGEDNKFVISVKNNLAVVSWDGESSTPLVPEPLVSVEADHLSTRLNDGKCDPSNRLWAGTMGAQIPGTSDQFEKEKGTLYLVKNKNTVDKQLSKVDLSNGLAWSLDKKTFYYIDSLKYRVNSYDFDEASGSISNEKPIFCFKENKIQGLPDGMTIDQEGMLWVACFGGGKVLKINPAAGKLQDTLEIPSLQVTSVAFGGAEFKDLYVTSAKIAFTKEMEQQYPLAGSTFRITGLGVVGTPSTPVQL